MQKSESFTGDQLLSNYFLLIIQNQRLHKAIQNQQASTSCVEDHYIRIMNELQEKKSIDRRAKEQKIVQLSRHIRQMHIGKQELSKNLDVLKARYNNLQSAYYSEISSYKQRISVLQGMATQSLKTCHECQQTKFKLQLEKKQKQQLEGQIQRLHKVTIRELQSNVQLLNRENQSYMMSINSYRTQINSFKAEKNKLDQQINKLSEQINSNNFGKFQQERQASIQKQEIKRLKQNCDQLSKRYKYQVEVMATQNRTKMENLAEKHQKQIGKANEKISHQSSEISNLKQQMKKQNEEMQRKSKKLKQYDDQYALYVNKMTSNHNQMVALKNQNIKLKQKCSDADKKIKQFQATMRLQHSDQINKILSENDKKIIEMQQNLKKQNMKEISLLQSEIENLKNEIQNLSKDQQHRYHVVEKQRDRAIEQWEQIANQMKKQKVIISSLQKQIEQYRKYNSDRMKASINDSKITNYQNFEARLSLDSMRGNTLISYRMKTQSYKDSYQKDQNENESNHRDELLKKQDKYLLISKLCSAGTIQKNGVPKVKQFSETNQLICCDECLSSAKQSNNLASNRIQKKSYRSLQIQRQPSQLVGVQNAKSKGSLAYQIDNILEPRLSLRSGNQKIPLSYKRRDDKFKKYHLNRTKTQEMQEKVSQTPQMARNAEFFSQNNSRLPSGRSKSPNSNTYTDKYSLKSNQIQSCHLQKPQLRENSSYHLVQKAIKFSSCKKNDDQVGNKQIQQYLSFDLNSLKSMGRSSSENKITSNNFNENSKTQIKAFLYDSGAPKNVLSQKINKIPFFKDQNEGTKQTKFYNFNKKPPQQVNLPRRGETKVLKQNINQIIHRKCQFLRQQ